VIIIINGNEKIEINKRTDKFALGIIEITKEHSEIPNPKSLSIIMAIYSD
jgi:hypothetical protein